ncbi:MAG: FtsW/RodA/SpoVE family cell cycle protein [Spirochaetota bacterium]
MEIYRFNETLKNLDTHKMLSLIRKLDWKLNFAVLFLIAAGLMTLVSSRPDLFWKQLIFAVVGIIVATIFIFFNWQSYANYRGATFWFYAISILLLIIAGFFAPSIRGTKGWLVFGEINFQVSEFAKLALILVFAKFFSRKNIGIAKFSNLLGSFLYFCVPAGLVALQPDFGSALVLFCIWFGFLLVSGIKYKHLIIAVIIFSILGGMVWNSVLENYQKDRIMGFIFSERDPLGVNYNVIQAKIAIGSAGLFGKGFGQGSQVQLGFLPEASTDFIFSAFIEEWGILAGFFLVLVFVFFILRIVKIGLDADNNFGRFICLGAVILFVVQFIFNIGSNLGLTPVIGVTFPFLSYGGSSLLTNLIFVGIIQSVFMRRSI